MYNLFFILVPENCQYDRLPGYYTSTGATVMSQYTTEGACLGGCDGQSDCVASSFRKASGSSSVLCSFFKTIPTNLVNNPNYVIYTQRPGCLSKYI